MNETFFLGFFGGLLILYFIIIGLCLALVVAGYVLNGLGLQALAKRRGYACPWLAWVPLGNVFLLGALGDDIRVSSGRKNWHMRWWLLAATGAVFLCALVLFISIFTLPFQLSANSLSAMPMFLLPLAGELLLMALSVGVSVLTYLALYELFREYEPKSSVLYLLLSIFLPLAMQICVFLIRKKQPQHPQTKPYA